MFSPDDGSGFRLPLFPLQTVLFPDGLLSLKVFEVRYLDMVSRCHEEGTAFGVVSLTQGREVRDARSTAESFHAVGTLAQIQSLERTHPGLLTVRCRGTHRFVLRGQEQLKHGLWMGDALLQDDDQTVPVPPDLLHVQQALRQVANSLAPRAHDGSGRESPIAEPFRWDDCGWVANRWCELLPVAAELKQRCMMLDNPLLRLELVADMLEKLRIVAGQADGDSDAGDANGGGRLA